ncbi:hypothetical protein, partial [Lactococcus muris]|uniref:hypothetical protein n=1 Tax=Lactococcus muris TaxID=2941330 RepID=UPI0023006C66
DYFLALVQGKKRPSYPERFGAYEKEGESTACLCVVLCCVVLCCVVLPDYKSLGVFLQIQWYLSSYFNMLFNIYEMLS